MYLSREDEIANCITHGCGIAISIAGAFLLDNRFESSELGMYVCVTAFNIALILVYLFSFLSHALIRPAWRYRMRAWDQGTIYFLIVGTYSPFVWNATESWTRFLILATVWCLALGGFVTKVVSAHRINRISTVTYVALGWIPAVPIFFGTEWSSLAWMAAGGVSYTAGILFLIQSSKRKYMHAAWHLMVMLGSLLHWLGIYYLK